MFDDDDGVACIHQLLQHLDEAVDISHVEAGSRLVENIHGLTRAAAGQLVGQLDTLRLAARKGRGALPQRDIPQAHVQQRLQLAGDFRLVGEEDDRLFHGHIQHVRDGLFLILDFQRFAVVACALADLAGNVDVRQEVHLDLEDAVALAGLAAAAPDVEAEPSRAVAPHFGVLRLGKDRADVVEHAGIGGGVGAGLHEFVPTDEADIKKLADAQGKTVEQIKTIIASLHEFNPMMGHRGCRLAVTYPEIAKMQTTAVIRAAIEVKKAHPDWTIKPEIMIPLVGDVKELKYVKKFVVETADAEIKAAGSDLQYEVGTMIEIPRAALTADEIAKEADFFCFGTNDLTQMTYGFSRDDAGKFLNAYYDAKIFENDPFAKLDQVGVGKLMKMAIELGKPVNPNLHVGICGEHGGDPSSVEFCHKIGLNYVSCSPFRVPIARLAAAQAAIAEKNA